MKFHSFEQMQFSSICALILMLQMMKKLCRFYKMIKMKHEIIYIVKMSLIINCSALLNVLKEMINELNDSLNEK